MDIFTPLMTPTKRCFSVKPLINIFFYMQHTSRTFYNNAGEVVQQDAGAWITPLDYLGIQPFSDIPMFKKALPHLRMEFMEVFLITCHCGISCGMWYLLIQCLSVGLWSFSAWPIHWNFIKEKYGIEYKLSGFANLIC